MQSNETREIAMPLHRPRTTVRATAVRAAAALAAVAALTTGCTSGSGGTAAPAAAVTANAPAAQAADTAAPAVRGTPGAQDLQVIRGFTDAANRGDVARITASYAPDAHFDRAGAHFTGRNEIVDAFLRPDVVDDDGHYREIAVTTRDGRTVVEYIFTTGSGVTEHFTYAYLIRDDVITDVVGRYV
ncbi:hypothetical protein KNE206_45700 [Kitasatospora sp. NE20-6]